MAINLGNYSFEGPFTTTSNLEDKSGIYAIMGKINEYYYALEIGESTVLKTLIENHDKRDTWQKYCKGELVLSILYTPDLQHSERKLIADDLTERFKPYCPGQISES